MSGPTGVQWLWPVPLLVRRLSQHQQLQQPLLQLFRQHRDDDGGGVPYASDDDLVTRYAQHGAVQALAQLLAQGVGEVAHQANQPVWSALQPQGLRVDLVGMWFQISNRYARHDVHTHGNCSWSGVYVVDVDPPQTREAHPDLGEENGLTRLHSPLMDRLGGAHMDLGAAWLQDSHVDIAPVPGQLVIWPSFLMHQALPYAGNRDRVIVSFNAAVRGTEGDQVRSFGF